MARGDTAQARINVTTNAEKAKNDIEEVNTLLKKLQKTKQLMMKEGLALDKDGKETATFKKLNRDIKDTQENLKRLTDRQTLMNRTLGNLNDIKLKELKTRYRELTKELGTFTGRQSADAKKWQQNLETIKAKITEIEGAGKGASKSMAGFGGSLKTTLKNLVAYAGVFQIFNQIKSALESIVKLNLQFSDRVADIRKVSGLAMKDINDLAKNLAKIDTRSSMESLLGLSYQGSKLGFGEYGIAGLESFTKAANQVNVALHEDLGDDAMVQLSKMTEVMGLIPKMGVEKAMLATGSAIFKLASTSTAAGGPIVEFSKRLMGLANQAGITADELVAFGASADSMALAPEVAATAFNKLITAMQKQPNLIENALGMSKGTINDLYQAGRMTDAIVKVFEAMNQKGGMNALMHAGVFKDLGSDGARLVGVMATMANRVDMVNKSLETSRKAFKDATAVTDEYNIQQETAAALVERANNMWNKSFVNPDGVDNVKELAQAWYDVSKALTENKAAMGAIRILIGGLMKALQGLMMVLPGLLYAFGTRGIIWMFTSLGRAFGAATISAVGFRGAWQALTLAMKANWISLAVGLLVQFTVYLVSTTDKLKELLGIETEHQKKMEEMRKAYVASNEEAEKTVQRLDNYKKALDDANLSQDQRTQLIKKFKNEYGDYLKYLGIEIKTIDDLRDAYADVVRVMKQKKLYEERENYKQSLTGERKIENRKVGVQIDEELKALGVDTEKYNSSYFDKQFRADPQRLIGYIMRDQFKGITEGDDEGIWVQNKKSRTAYKSYNTRRLSKLVSQYIEKARGIADDEAEADKMWVNDLKGFDNDKFEEGKFKSHLNNNFDPLQNAPDKEAARAARKAQQDEKQALRKELQDAKQESDAIISKIEEWYRLQETTITAFAADGKWTQQQADVMIDQLNQAKNQALAAARHGISGRDTEAWDVMKQQIGTLMFDTSDMSKHLLDDILKVRLENVRKSLSHIDKAGNQYGITSGSLRDSINKNAAGNLREVERIQKKSVSEIEKMLKQYDFFQQAVDAFNNRLTQLGLLTESAAAAARRIQQAAAAEGTPEALRPDYRTAEQQEADYQRRRSEGMAAAASRFIAGGAQSMTVNYNDTAELDRWLRELTGAEGTIGSNGFEFQFASWADAFREDFDRWLHDSGKYKSEIQAFYLSLVQASDDYTEATRKAYEREKKLQDQRFRLAGYRDEEERTDTSLQRDQQMKDAGVGTSLPEQLGLDKIADDPEILRIQNRIHWRNLEYEDAKRNLEAQMELDRLRIEDMKRNGATEQEIENAKMEQKQNRAGLEELMKERETALINETYNLTTQVAQQMQKRVDSIKNFVKPVTDFTQAAGRKIGDMIFNMESEEATWEELWKNMALAVGEAIIEMGAQYMQNYIMQKSINQASEEEAVSDATVKTMAGISAGGAKTIGELGWWGIPLVAVISALLMGLLQAALSTKKSSGSDAKTPKTNVKLKSGMLTYDEGTGIPGYGSRRAIGSGSQWRGQNGEYISGYPRSVSGGSSAVSRPAPVLGDDGRFYRATPQPTLPEGVSIVRKPIATTVNGQQALVAERGPEIVIGRKTTRRLMMNEPGLLRALATADRGITTRRLRTFDEGNIADLAQAIRPVNGGTSAVPAPEGSSDSQQQDRIAAALEQNTQMMVAFTQMMANIQRDGIQARVAKYGSGSLDEGMREISAFRRRYPNG